MNREKNILENIAADSWYARGVCPIAIRYAGSIFDRYLIAGSVLELGPAEGVMTDYFAHKYTNITVVDGSARFCSELEKQFPKVEVINALFEDFEPRSHYDNIILGHVLEHVIDPVNILSRIRNWLSPDGIIAASVPNALSLHRQAAVIMKLLKNEHDLNEADKHHGHRRVYEPASFKADFIAANLKINKFGGYWMKPLSNRQIEEHWTSDMIEAFMKLGERYPEIAAELYIVASK